VIRPGVRVEWRGEGIRGNWDEQAEDVGSRNCVAVVVDDVAAVVVVANSS
jgi:hypothetical protein